MSQFKALVVKEMKEALRDKRAFMAAMFMALLAPIIIFALSKTAISDVTEKPDIFIAIDGAQHAPDLVKKLEDDGIYAFELADEVQSKEWSKRQIRLEIPETYVEYMNEGRSIDLKTYADLSDKSIAVPLDRVESVISAYSSNIVAKRIMMRGISIGVLRPFKVERKDTAIPNSNAMFISTSLLFYMLFGAFVTGLSVAIDTSAGERERNVLELLLSQPVSTMQILAAKLLSASSVAIIGVVLTLVLTSFAVGFIDLSAIGATFQLGTYAVTTLIALLIPICFFASILQLYLAFQAKTFKEAQSTVTMIIMFPAFIPFALMMMDNRPEWMEWLPISGQYLLAEEVIKGASVSLGMVTVVSAITLVLTALIFMALAKKLQSEKTVLALS